MPKSVTVFEDNVNYFRAIGKSPLEAKHRAIDYYRQFTKREVTSTWDIFSEKAANEDQLDVEEILYLNEVFSKVVDECLKRREKKSAKIFCLLLRLEGLDAHLNEKNLDMSDLLCGNDYPEAIWEVGVMAGFKVKSTTCVPLYAYKRWLGGIMKDLNLVEC